MLASRNYESFTSPLRVGEQLLIYRIRLFHFSLKQVFDFVSSRVKKTNATLFSFDPVFALSSCYATSMYQLPVNRIVWSRKVGGMYSRSLVFAVGNSAEPMWMLKIR